MVEEKEKKKVQENTDDFQLVDVVSKTEKMIKTPTGEFIQVDEAIVEVLNQLKEIKKFLG